MVGWRWLPDENPETQSQGGRGRPKKTLTEMIHADCLALGLTETLPPDIKVWSGKRSQTGPTPTQWTS